MIVKQKLWTTAVLFVMLALMVAACGGAQPAPDTAALDQAKAFGERCAALKQQAWPVCQSIKERIKGPTDPEVFFDILGRRAEALGRRRIKTQPCLIVCCDDLIECGDHHVPACSFNIGRKRLCIQLGNVDRPDIRSARSTGPSFGL